MKTYSTKATDIQPQWHVLDASGQILGKLATRAATLLLGKHKPIFTPHLDTGDFVVIINAEKVRVSGGKEGGRRRPDRPAPRPGRGRVGAAPDPLRPSRRHPLAAREVR